MADIKQAAAKKAARTRAYNRAVMKRWHEIDEPAMRRRDALYNHLLEILEIEGRFISLHWRPLGNTGRKLKNNAQYGILVKILHGGSIWRVLPEGYKRPHDFHSAFWEIAP